MNRSSITELSFTFVCIPLAKHFANLWFGIWIWSRPSPGRTYSPLKSVHWDCVYEKNFLSWEFVGGVDEPTEQPEIPPLGRITRNENDGLKFRKENEPRVRNWDRGPKIDMQLLKPWIWVTSPERSLEEHFWKRERQNINVLGKNQSERS